MAIGCGFGGTQSSPTLSVVLRVLPRRFRGYQGVCPLESLASPLVVPHDKDSCRWKPHRQCRGGIAPRGAHPPPPYKPLPLASRACFRISHHLQPLFYNNTSKPDYLLQIIHYRHHRHHRHTLNMVLSGGSYIPSPPASPAAAPPPSPPSLSLSWELRGQPDGHGHVFVHRTTGETRTAMHNGAASSPRVNGAAASPRAPSFTLGPMHARPAALERVSPPADQ